MSGHTDGASTADQLRDLIRENQRLVAELRRRDEALEALADGLDREATERDGIADRLPATSAYHLEINRLVVAAEHQRRCAKRLRRVLAAHEQAEEAR